MSIPDDVFEKVEQLKRRTKQSRSAVFSTALKEYVARHEIDEVTEAMSRVGDSIHKPETAFGAAAARRILRSVEW